jgi:uncharacterized cofD-like protein
MKKIVTIGGGTGSFMLLSGLRTYPVELSAIVSMADDGGSTGLLRDELGVLPPGDVRQCLVALSDSSETLRELMAYRFAGGGLSGHSFGNLLLSALEKTTGDFLSGVREAASLLNVKGEVVPVTGSDTELSVVLKDGTRLRGEHAINTHTKIGKTGIRRVFLDPAAKANPRALKKIREADFIIIGPGNHYCSILPNLLVSGIPEAIRRSKAKVVYNGNLVNKRGHTDGFTLWDYVREINRFLGSERIDFVTFNKRRPNAKLLERYQKEDSELVTLGERPENETRAHVIATDLLSRKRVVSSSADAIARYRSFIRHDSEKLARIIMMLTEWQAYEDIFRDLEEL